MSEKNPTHKVVNGDQVKIWTPANTTKTVKELFCYD